MIRTTHPWRPLAGVLALTVWTVTPSPAQTPDELAVGATLDALHEAAASADFEAYFALYARELVFLGTDATERWNRAEFMAYARDRFRQGQGWTYAVLERHLTMGPDGRTAWFHERLEHARLGETRGTGVLVREDGDWKVAQYHLTIPVPNELASEVVARIQAPER